MSVNTILNKPPGYKGVGRPCKLTPELQEKICKLIAAGNYITTSCQACGVDRMTYARWLELGQAEADAGEADGQFYAFLCAAKEAEAHAEVQLVADVKLHTNRNVVAPLAILDRRFRERWGQSPTVQPGGNTYNVNIEKAIIDASEKFKEIIARTAERVAAPILLATETAIDPLYKEEEGAYQAEDPLQ